MRPHWPSAVLCLAIGWSFAGAVIFCAIRYHEHGLGFTSASRPSKGVGDDRTAADVVRARRDARARAADDASKLMIEHYILAELGEGKPESPLPKGGWNVNGWSISEEKLSAWKAAGWVHEDDLAHLHITDVGRRRCKEARQEAEQLKSR
jgi:hypothetical protein